MKITKILIPIILLVVIGAFFLFASQTEAPTKVVTTVTETTNVKEKEIEPNSGSQDTQTYSRYVIHSPQTYEQYNGKKRILFFYASWCPTCQPVNKDLMDNSIKIPEDFVVIRVNYKDAETDDLEKALAKKYAVTYQHTFVVIDEEGNEITKWNGGDFKDILDRIK
jgi:thioredoxin 1